MKRVSLLMVFSSLLFPLVSSGWPPIDEGFLKLVPKVESEEEKEAASAATLAAAEKAWQAVPAGEHIFRAPFVVADKQKREVIFWGAATGMNSLEPTEFYVIGPDSGHDYESIGITFAKPSDIDAALRFVGFEPGWPVEPGKLRFWPKGHRVMMDIYALHEGSIARRPVEEYILMNEGRVPIERLGLVFTGSKMVENPAAPGSLVYAADIYGPNGVASDYNEINSVLELPRQGTKGEVYGEHVANPSRSMPTGQAMIFLITPHPTLTEVLSIDLRVSPEGMQLTQPDGTPLHAGSSMKEMLTRLKALKDQEPFVTIKFSDELTVQRVIEACGQIEQIEKVKGFRVDPPSPRHLYYKAFISNPTFLDRARRPSQPIEFHLASADKFAGELVVIEEKWGAGTDPELIVKPFAIASSEEFEQRVKTEGEDINTLFVYVPIESLTYGALQKMLAPYLERFPVIYIYPRAEQGK